MRRLTPRQACMATILHVLLLVFAPAHGAEDFSADYDRIFQIRVVSPDAGGKSSIGSGFQVSDDGLILTNYHVVSSYVNAPDAYEIRYTTHDNRHGRLELLDVDVIADLALLRHPDPDTSHFEFSTAPPTRGDMAYALGNPADWGIVMVPGPNNGLVEHQYERQILFSGSLNPGMSGGPSLDRDGRVIGVNVATAGSQLSFLVPADKARRLIAAGRHLAPADYTSDITRQIKAWQSDRVADLLERDWPDEAFAGRTLFGEIRHDFQCWGDTNESVDDRAMARVSRFCDAGDQVFLADDLTVGQISFSFKELTPLTLGSAQFARSQTRFLMANNDSAFEHSTNFQCRSDFVETGAARNDAYQHVITCLRAYRNMPGLYDAEILVQHQQSRRAFVARLSLSAMEADHIQAFNRRFMEQTL